MSIFSITLFGIHIAPSWYGLMYALGFIAGYLIIRSRKIFSDQDLDSLVLFVFLGVILGGRLGYVLFYEPSYFLAHPGEIIKMWRWGMSFHGGAIGVIIAMGIYALRYRKSFLLVADQVTSILPIGLGLGRIGNYLNGELLGFTPYTGPLAIIKNNISHFPSTLLEAVFEGVILFIILSYFIRHQKYSGQIASHFLLWYGVFRFAIEFVRLPDAQIGYLFGGITMGQLLSIPMIVFWVFFLFFFKTRKYA